MAKNTMTDLVEVLKEYRDNKLKEGKPVYKIETIILRAERGDYHDFKSDLAMPKYNLAMDLQVVGAYQIKKDVINGVYDEDPDEEDLNMLNGLMAEGWFNNIKDKHDLDAMRYQYVNRKVKQ